MSDGHNSKRSLTPLSAILSQSEVQDRGKIDEHRCQMLVGTHKGNRVRSIAGADVEQAPMSSKMV